MRYINYARRSSDEKSKKQVQSIEDQLSDTRRYSNENNLNIVEEMTESKSAKEPGRPVFNSMIKKIRNGEADAIVCWKLDRLARNPIDAATLRWMMRQGLLLEIRTPYQIYRPEDNAVITAVESAMAEQYIIDLKKGVERGMHSKCEKGGFPFMVPQGYYNDRLNRSVKKDEERFPVLRQAWELLLSEKYPLSQIHHILVNEWGYRGKITKASPTGKITLTTLDSMFRNPFYRGSFKFQGKIYTHNFPLMVTAEEWEKAQQILNRRSYKFSAKVNHAYTGLITCVSCGYAVTAEISKGHTYYHCVNKYGLCTKKGIREEEIDKKIDAMLESITMPAVFEVFCCQVFDELKEKEETQKEQIQQSKQSTVNDIKRQKEALLSLFLAGHLESEEYANKKQELNRQELGLTQENKAGSSIKHMENAVKKTISFVANGRCLFAACAPEEKRMITRQLADNYFLNNSKELQIELHPYLEQVRSSLKPIFSGIEPLKIGSGSWNTYQNRHMISEWCSTLAEYLT